MGGVKEKGKRMLCSMVGDTESVYSLHLFHVLIEKVKNVPLLSLRPVTFDMVVPGAPRHCRDTSASCLPRTSTPTLKGYFS